MPLCCRGAPASLLRGFAPSPGCRCLASRSQATALLRGAAVIAHGFGLMDESRVVRAPALDVARGVKPPFLAQVGHRLGRGVRAQADLERPPGLPSERHRLREQPRTLAPGAVAAVVER